MSREIGEPFCLCGFCNCDYDLDGYSVKEYICGACVSQCYNARGYDVEGVENV